MSRPFGVSVTLTLRLALAAQERRERLLELGQALRRCGEQHRADGDVDQIVGAGAAIAESEPRLLPAKRQSRPPPAAQRHGPDLLDLGIEPARLAGRPRPARASSRDRRRCSMCWSAQPPHAPKCGQIGAMRSGLASSTSSRPARSLPWLHRDPDPLARKVNGTKIGPSGPSATPSPFAPRRSISTSSSMARADQEFLVAAAAENRRSDLADDRPARLLDEVRGPCHRLFALGGLADDAALADRRRPASNCGLTSATSQAPRRGKR